MQAIILLIAVRIAWVMVAMFGLFSVVQLQRLTDVQAELLWSGFALKPMVPTISTETVGSQAAKDVIENYKAVYPGIAY